MLKKMIILVSYLMVNCFLLNADEGVDDNTNVCSTEPACDSDCAQQEECDDCHLCNKKPGPTYVDNEEVVWQSDTEHAKECGLCGAWLPEVPPLFRPFIADPREVDYSVGWRFDDQALAHRVVDVSFGDTLVIYQWANVWPWNGKLQIELEGALWAVFAPCEESAPLINADYYVAIPITYAIDEWSFRIRFFHISSHIGDEFLLNHLPKGFKRLNPSYEFLDFFASYEFTDDIRLYGGIGWIVDQDESFICSNFYAAAGLELRPWAISYTDYCNRLYGVPIYGMHFRFSRDYKHHLDSTYVLGYEWGKLSGLERRLRIFLEYHDGYSAEGQFSRFATNYLSIRASYGF